MNQPDRKRPAEDHVSRDERETSNSPQAEDDNWVHSEGSELLILEANCRDLFSRPPDAILPKSA